MRNLFLAGLFIASLYAGAQTPQASQPMEIHQKTFGKNTRGEEAPQG
jgi:hypothetical protein